METIEALVTSVQSKTPSLTEVVLEVPAEVQGAFERPGQYVVIHPEGQEKPVFLALASAPGQALTLLLGPGATEQVAPSEGKRLRMAPPGGKGYPVDEAEGGDLLLFSIGSAASAITSVVEYVRANRARFGAVTLYHGAKAEDEHAYRERDEAWGADGIAVHRTTGKPWVQDVFRAQPVATEGAMAFVCGSKPMVQGVTEALTEAGLPAEKVRQNF